MPALPPRAETVLLTALALLAFAANSLLTRVALGGGHLDAASFTAVRLTAGAVVLVILVRAQAGSFAPLRGGGWRSPLYLFAYAAPFTFAYLRIGAALGALVLFGTVQLTMIGWGVARGERPGARTWLGLALAAGGLGWLMLPATGRPDLPGVALMVLAGVAWGAYSLAGKGAPHPLAANARSFLGSVPAALLLSLLMLPGVSVTGRGLLLAVLSGAVTSGLGYAIWYRALRGLTAVQAAVLQLAVPIIAAVGAIGLLDEPASLRLLLAGLAVIGGVGLALLARRPAGAAR